MFEPAFAAHRDIAVVTAETHLFAAENDVSVIVRRAFTVALAPQSHIDLISVIDSAISKSLRLPGNIRMRKSVRKPKQSTGIS